MTKNFTFKSWVDIFATNAAKVDAIPWEEADTLPDSEKKIIYESIRQFQRGESGEGKYLFTEAKKFVEQCTDDSYLIALRLFILEENRHARYLLQFMNAHGIDKIEDHWVDNIFRWLRHHGNLEISVRVLVTAEYISAVYYKALRDATNSKALEAISQRILEDEDIHIRFQTQALAYFEQGRSEWVNKGIRGLHQLLLGGTISVVWLTHRKVLQAGGYRFGRFASECLLVYFESLIGVNPAPQWNKKSRRLSPAAF